MSQEELSNWRDHPCILEVDLTYPEHLQDLHNDYPLAPENVKVDRVSKLIPNLNDKQRYTIHRENLKFYLNHGLELITTEALPLRNQIGWNHTSCSTPT